MNFSIRHFVKAISWRIIGTLDTFVFAFIISNDFDSSFNISVITTFTKIFWYYMHEQLWAKIRAISTNNKIIFKTFTWRVLGTFDTIFFSWFMIGDFKAGLKIGFFETISKMILYYIHERLWQRSKFGLN